MDEILAAFEQAAMRPLAYAREWKRTRDRRVIGIFRCIFPANSPTPPARCDRLAGRPGADHDRAQRHVQFLLRL